MSVFRRRPDAFDATPGRLALGQSALQQPGRSDVELTGRGEVDGQFGRTGISQGSQFALERRRISHAAITAKAKTCRCCIVFDCEAHEFGCYLSTASALLVLDTCPQVRYRPASLHAGNGMLASQ
jgi:hypothetical protein